MGRLTRGDGTAKIVSRDLDQNLRRQRGQGNIKFPCSADQHERDWQPYPVDPYFAICDDHTYILYTYILIVMLCRYYRYFQYAHFIPIIVGVGKRGAY